MDEPLYDVYFTGKLVEGADPEAAKSSFMQLFKANPETADRFFNGKPQVLKRGLDKAEALKYKAVLHKAGMMVAFKAQQDAPAPAAAPAPSPAPSPAAVSPGNSPESDRTAPAQSTTASTAEDDWSVAPAGSDVLRPEERHEVAPVDIDTSAIKMVSAFASQEPEAAPPPPAPDTSHLSAAPAGEDLLPEKAPPPPPLDLNLDAISLAPPGTELEELKPDLPELNPDTSGLSIADAGVDLLEGQHRDAPPAPPNTDHLKVLDGDS